MMSQLTSHMPTVALCNEHVPGTTTPFCSVSTDRSNNKSVAFLLHITKIQASASPNIVWTTLFFSVI